MTWTELIESGLPGGAGTDRVGLPCPSAPTGFVPLDGSPDAVQPLVRLNPLTAVTETMTALGTGTVTAGQLVAAISWSVGLACLGLVLLVRPRHT